MRLHPLLIRLAATLVVSIGLSVDHAAAQDQAAFAAFCPNRNYMGGYTGPCMFSVYHPGYIRNSTAGSIVAHKGGGLVGAMIGAMVGQLGQHWTHTGMITSNDLLQVTHNGMDQFESQNAAGLDVNLALLFASPILSLPSLLDPTNLDYGKVLLSPMGIFSGTPGNHTTYLSWEGGPDPVSQTVVREVLGEINMEWNTADWVLKNPLPGNGQVAAQNMVAARKSYRLHAYADMDAEWNRAGGGSHCSGTIAFASGQTGRAQYSNAQVQAVSRTVYDLVYAQAKSKIWSEVPWYVPMPSWRVEAAARGVADQLVNCFLYGDTLSPGLGCPLVASEGYFHGLWSNNTTLQGRTVSPDDLVGALSPPGYSAGAQMPDYVPAFWELHVIGDPSGATQFVRQSVPATMAAGSTATVSVTFKNLGGLDWGSAYAIRSRNIYDLTRTAPPWNPGVLPPPTWGIEYVYVTGQKVLHDKEYTFNFSIRAPTTRGTYDFQWQISRPALIGQASPMVRIVVN